MHLKDFRRPRLLFVGAFPPTGSDQFGGHVADCEALLQSSFPSLVDLTLMDSGGLPGHSRAPMHRRIGRMLRRASEFRRLLRLHKPDAVLMLVSGGLSFLERSLYAAVARRQGAAVIVSIRSGHFIDLSAHSKAFRFIARRLLRLPHVLLCQGARWQQFFASVYGLPEDKCPIVEPWVASASLLEIGELRRERGGFPVRLLFLGSIETFKGVDELVEAASILKRADTATPWQFTVAGTGPRESDIRQRIEALSLENDVCLVGRVEGDGKLSVLRDADIFVLPSHTEGLPNAMVEAMAAGLPVVASSVGSIPDVIRSGENGILVEPRQALGLALAVARLIRDPSERRALGHAAHVDARSRFGAEQAATRIAAIIAEAVAASRVSGTTRAPASLGGP